MDHDEIRPWELTRRSLRACDQPDDGGRYNLRCKMEITTRHGLRRQCRRAATRGSSGCPQHGG